MRFWDVNTISQKMLYDTAVDYLIYWKVSFIVGTHLQLALNSIIFFDLWLTLRNPFYPRRKRNKYYNTFFLLVLTYSSTFTIIYLTKNDISLTLYDFDKEFVMWAFRVLLSSLFLLVIIPMIGTLLILCRRGTSKELRRKVLKYHIAFFLLYSISMIASAYDQWHSQVALGFSPESYETYNKVAESIFNSVGVPMALNRLFEPFVWNEFKY